MTDHQHIQKIEPYQRLAGYYDRLMDFIDYDIWVDDIEALLEPYHPGKAILDISCGTGSMAVRLAQRGWQLTAVDLSSYMIEMARVKAREAEVALTFAVGDMVQYHDGRRYDVIINLHDGLNYLLDDKTILAFLDNAHDLLEPEGILIFDVVTPLLCQTHFRGYREIFHDELGGYERYTSYDPVTYLAKSVFTLNTEQADTVDVETHLQRAYELADVQSFVESSPFTRWQILDDETLEQGNAQSERFLVVLRKSS